MRRREVLRLLGSTGALAMLPVSGALAASEDDTVWAGLVTDVFGDRPMRPGEGVVALDAPYRAEDAALVPITIALPDRAGAAPVTKVTLTVDRNPAPVAAVFTIGDGAGVTRLSTRVRVNTYSRVHAVAETADGQLFMAEKFVKASGGCSAPAGKDPKEALANLGRMKVRWFGEGDTAAAASSVAAGTREAQVMIRHPNNSGLQMDQVTRLYIPAHFVDKVDIRQGDRLVLGMEGGISISEDPNFRFTYRPTGADSFVVEAQDTEGKRFSETFPVLPASG